jgi:uncharacterized protein YxjI
MKYLIRQRVLSFGDDFGIKDENGQDRYMVQGKVFSFGDKLKLMDMMGNELFYIEQRLFRFLPEYYIFAGGEEVAVVKKQLSLFTPKFIISSIHGAYDIEGDVFAYDFSVYKDGRRVAVVNKRWFSFSDTYGIDIADGEDHALLLSLAIVLDQILHDENKR